MTREIKERLSQISKGSIPDGYERTKLGLKPIDWGIDIIGDCLERIGRKVEVVPGNYYTQIGIRSHGKGVFKKNL